ncbi:hypothetical protein ACGFWD_40900 [Streptomyces sp. NPDC048448]|uniref:hypothetical protein n=1 Tax=unclassified Streptomyces TaxID=2593676 RepID=UPI00143E9F9F|nr:hypothetical protein [Streptomyces sp. RPA4-2]QIY66332.1 hypothetical protein HEP85_38310 [Streptomyces sp. RPA4-2]
MAGKHERRLVKDGQRLYDLGFWGPARTTSSSAWFPAMAVSCVFSPHRSPWTIG